MGMASSLHAHLALSPLNFVELPGGHVCRLVWFCIGWTLTASFLAQAKSRWQDEKDGASFTGRLLFNGVSKAVGYWSCCSGWWVVLLELVIPLGGNGPFGVGGAGGFKSRYKQQFPWLVCFLNASMGEDSFLDLSLHQLDSGQ